jgi:acyl dehydratase
MTQEIPMMITLDQLKAGVGGEPLFSPWRTVTQEIIDKFADATDDHQFIHVDPERARAETPFGGTIAHGFLTLSMLSALARETLPRLAGASMGINYGFDRLRFVSPVKEGARIRGRFELVTVNVRPSGWVQVEHEVAIEIEGSRKPAISARWQTIAVLDRKQEETA